MDNMTKMTEQKVSRLSGKINAHHLDRMAIVYVRQSTLQQVQDHQESTRLQYELVEKAWQLGWSREHIQVIDDDLGCSGSSIEGRPGFQRLMAEVAMDHVGIVLGRETSRFVRSSRDMYQLLDTCAIFTTLIGDQDGIYDPGNYNDRLLLGLKGSMSEAELHILKQRMEDGKWSKARRGELVLAAPMGYIRHPGGKIIKDPDEQVRLAIETIFTMFERTQTINGVLKYMVTNAFQLPRRVVSGPCKGDLEWHRPNRTSIHTIVRHPFYAGAYVYGRRRVDPRKKRPGHPNSGRVWLPAGECEVLIKDRHPAYINWEQFEKNQQQLKDNSSKNLGVAREGSSLLSGLLHCGHCGVRMTTCYSNNGYGLRYVCCKQAANYGEASCQSLSGKTLDECIEQWVFKALEPAALEVSMAVAADLEAEQDHLNKHWEQRLERAKIDGERAFRQYNAVEPENRLVARTLEHQLEEALAQKEQLKQEYQSFVAHIPKTLGAKEQAEIRQLADNIPALWRADSTTSAERQQIVRELIEQIVVTVEGQTEIVQLTIHWKGGHQTATRMCRPVARFDQLSNYSSLLERIKALHQQGKGNREVARHLNDENWHSPRINAPYNANTVRKLLHKTGVDLQSRSMRYGDEVERAETEWTIAELSGKLNIPVNTLQAWLRAGKVSGRITEVRGFKLWLVQADEAELNRIDRLHKQI